MKKLVKKAHRRCSRQAVIPHSLIAALVLISIPALARAGADGRIESCASDRAAITERHSACAARCERDGSSASSTSSTSNLDACTLDCGERRDKAMMSLIEKDGCPAIERDLGPVAGAEQELIHGLVETPAGMVDANLAVVDGDALFEGDIVVGRADEIVSRTPGLEQAKAVARRFNFWPNSVVAYTIDPGLPNPQRVRDAIAQIHASTNVRFVPRVWASAYVTFARTTDPNICGSSTVGRQGDQQILLLNDACGVGTVVHEALHALGFWHEQSRVDRDKSINILWQNIDPSYQYNFQTYVQADVDGQDIGRFDFNSIMLYGPYSFSTNGLPTITRRGGALYEAQRDGLSTLDTKGVNAIYKTIPIYLWVNLQGIGFQLAYGNTFAGTKGQNRRLEQFGMNLGSWTPGLTVEYRANIQDLGDTGWMREGEFVGLAGRRLEGFAIRLKGPEARKYKVSYSAHIEEIGDTRTVTNGAFCGTRGRSLQVEGMTVRIERRG